MREVLCVLDLDYVCYPCPREEMTEGIGECNNDGHGYRSAAKRIGGKVQFPLLVDSGKGIHMYGSRDIVEYLFATYGPRDAPPPRNLFSSLPFLDMATLGIAVGMRPMREHGMLRLRVPREATRRRLPQKKLRLYGYEPNPLCKLVRECLCTLEVPYIHHSVARGSASRISVQGSSRDSSAGHQKNRGGTELSYPFLFDPNTNVELFESEVIVTYLMSTYGYVYIDEEADDGDAYDHGSWDEDEDDKNGGEGKKRR